MSTSHQTGLVHDSLPSDELVAYHAARARGGAGLICIEATAPHPSSLLTSHTLAGYAPGMARAYRRLADAVQPHGTLLVVQLLHGGREQIAGAPRAPALAPSPLPSQRFRTEPRQLSAGEIAEIVAGFGTSAAVAAEAGLDGVEISGAHGYLVAQFFTPELNRRDDEWGDPARFLTAVLAAVRAAAPQLALGLRLSADAPAAPAAARVAAAAVDYLSLALGDSATPRAAAGIVPPPPTPRAVIGGLTEPFRVGVPIIATSRIVDPADGERLIAHGHADAVGMTRALIADPDLPRKVREGRLDELIACTACNACIAHYHEGTPIRCAQNPRTGRELTLPRPARARARRRVVVVGGGPAGLAAAAEAGAAGHAVILIEASERLGGQIALAGASPAHAETAAALVDDFARALRRGSVEVRLGEAAGATTVAALEPHHVVVATGARPFDPGIPLGRVPVLQAWDVLGGGRPPGRRVLVADWGGDPAGLAAAELLAGAGYDVLLASSSLLVGESVHQYARARSLERLYRAGVTIVHHHALAGAGAEGVLVRNVLAPDLESEVAADAVVVALGRVPAGDPWEHGAGPDVPVERAGDCLGPRSLEEAILEGTLAARAA